MLLLPLVALWQGCGCPPNERVGGVELAQETLEAVPYTGNEQLRFVDQAGEVLVLSAPLGLASQSTVLCVRKICTEKKFDGKSTCEFFEGQARSMVFRDASQNFVLEVAMTTAVYGAYTRQFYDYFRVSLSALNYISQGGSITKVRFEGGVDMAQTEVQRHFVSLASVTLNGRVFTDVLAQESDQMKLYYSIPLGLLGFSTPENTWVLE